MTVHLFLGGARSGKSRAAQDLVLSSGLRPVYVATSHEPGDDEFAARVARHRQDRGPQWTTVEEHLDIAGALRTHATADTAVVVDCCTLWLSNLLAAERDVDAAVDELCDVLGELPGTVALVTNEVGQGVVPMHALTRVFRDHQGWLNQRLAATADHVRLLVAGIEVAVKG